MFSTPFITPVSRSAHFVFNKQIHPPAKTKVAQSKGEQLCVYVLSAIL